MGSAILKRVEPALLARHLTSRQVVDAVDYLAHNIPKGTFGPVILHPQDFAIAMFEGMKFGVVVNYPSGGGILQREIQVLDDLVEPNVLDLCMRTPHSVMESINPTEARKWVYEAARLVDNYKYPLKKVRLLYDTQFIDTPTLEAIVDKAKEVGFRWIKTSTGVYTKADPHEFDRVFKLADDYGLKVKVAGGISTLEEVNQYVKSGAQAVGTSSWKAIFEETTGKV